MPIVGQVSAAPPGKKDGLRAWAHYGMLSVTTGKGRYGLEYRAIRTQYRI
ncbi:hypothetical protein KIF59_19385 [Enterobacter cloacae subsp. cloacae]|nr:hypothetical protein [Enterobacter cloacae subsp. cloacae]